MRQLIERLKSEKIAIERENNERYQTPSQARKQAYNAGKAVARVWIQNSSYQEIMDVLHHLTAQLDSHSLRSKIHIYFSSITKVCPKEAQRFKWAYNDAFMDGWRDGVFTIWNAIRRDVDNEPINIQNKISP